MKLICIAVMGQRQQSLIDVTAYDMAATSQAMCGSQASGEHVAAAEAPNTAA